MRMSLCRGNSNDSEKRNDYDWVVLKEEIFKCCVRHSRDSS